MRTMTLVPVGGLANRMRAVASAITLMRKCNGKVNVVWFRDWALNAPFKELFEPVNMQDVSFTEGSWWNWMLYDRPRKRNFWIPTLFQRLYYNFTLYENQVKECFGWNDELEKAVSSGRSYVASFYQLVAYEDELIRNLFRPVQSVLEDIDRRCQEFSTYTIGIHIRRTDNVVSIQRSPLELFFKVVDEVLATHSDLCVYLATDSEEVKGQMRERYGERIITASSVADRNSIAGIRDGIVDMYTLGRTQKIYGSSGSTFSEMASRLGGVPLEMVRLKTE